MATVVAFPGEVTVTADFDGAHFVDLAAIVAVAVAVTTGECIGAGCGEGEGAESQGDGRCGGDEGAGEFGFRVYAEYGLQGCSLVLFFCEGWKGTAEICLVTWNLSSMQCVSRDQTGEIFAIAKKDVIPIGIRTMPVSLLGI